MKRWFYTVLLTFLVWTSENFCAQSAFAQQDLWEEQAAWEGVPEYNGFDSWIPGYLAIPINVKGKAPVIVGLHGAKRFIT